MKRNRPNKYHNRYNQWVIAGKVAIRTGAIIIKPEDKAYYTNSGGIHYSVVGQDYLRQLGISITELI